MAQEVRGMGATKVGESAWNKAPLPGAIPGSDAIAAFISTMSRDCHVKANSGLGTPDG